MSVSIITACKNRRRALFVSLASWIQLDQVSEIIVTDWNSDQPIDDLTRLSKKIKVIRVNNEPYFNQPQPLNLAASLVKTEYIMKLDCDHVLNPYFNFFEMNDVKDDYFISGCNSVDQNSMDAYFLYPIWGLLYVKTEAFKHIGGYNENMGKYYAVEDDELSMRLMSYGLKPKFMDVQKFSVLHLPHTDKDRVQNFESFESISQLLNENKKDLPEHKRYTYMTQLCKNKNHKEHPSVTKMIDLFTECSETGELSVKSLEYLVGIECYSEPIYKWNLRQLNGQVYEAVKL